MHRPIPAGTRRRTQRALLAAVLPAALAAAALPAAAHAATVSRASDGTVNYVASSGETNFVTVFEPVVGTIAVRDLVPVRAGSGCVAIGTTQVRCTVASRVNARLGDRNDTFVAQMGFASAVDGGAGDDQYFHNGSAGLSTTRVDFTGNTGVDTATYSAAAGAGVLVNKDGLPNDGRLLPGAFSTIDRDNIRADVENLIGTPRDDVMIGAGGTGTGQETYRALAGDDVMIGNGGNDSFETGTSADGADRIVGGNDQHFDSVGYGDRSVGVSVRADDGRANDGGPGEGDEIIGVEGLVGSPQSDTFFGSPTSTRGMLMMGGAGDDLLSGTAGGDNLFGEAGIDNLFGNAGADSLQAGDGQRDNFLDCGGNPAGFGDLVNRDGVDPAGIACETSQIGRLSLTPKALSADAGERLRLKLSWRHPRSWRDLREVKLRLTDDNVPLGEIAIRPRSERITADGAVRLVGKASRLTRKGKTVTARVAVRLDESLTGQTLKAEVEATDRRGRRQLERDAGSIRVAE